MTARAQAFLSFSGSPVVLLALNPAALGAKKGDQVRKYYPIMYYRATTAR